MNDIKTKDDVRNFFWRDPNTGEYVFMMGSSSRISEDAWLLLDDEEAKALLVKTVQELKQELIQRLDGIEKEVG